MLGIGRGYELYGVGGGMCCWVPVYFLLLAARTPLLNVKAGVERAALHPCAAAECVLPAAGWRGKALVLQWVVRIGGVGCASFAGFGCAFHFAAVCSLS